MPARKKAKSKAKSNRKLKLTPSRLIKTNGKFSRGKLATLVVVFVAIGALVVSMTYAFSYTDVVNWQTVADPHNHWYDSGSCGDFVFNGKVYVQVPACSYDMPGIAHGHIIWWGPYHRLGIPSPTGMNDQLCINYSVDGPNSGSYVGFNVEVTANYGQTLLATYGVYDGPHSNYTLYCRTVHVGPSIAGYWDGVEYRVRAEGGSLFTGLNIAQVGLFQ